MVFNSSVFTAAPVKICLRDVPSVVLWKNKPILLYTIYYYIYLLMLSYTLLCRTNDVVFLRVISFFINLLTGFVNVSVCVLTVYMCVLLVIAIFHTKYHKLFFHVSYFHIILILINYANRTIVLLILTHYHHHYLNKYAFKLHLFTFIYIYLYMHITIHCLM